MKKNCHPKQGNQNNRIGKRSKSSLTKKYEESVY